MFNPESIEKRKEYLDPISQIRIDSRNWIETIFITNRKIPSKKKIKRYYFDKTLKSYDKLADKNGILHSKELQEDKGNVYFYNKLLNKKEAIEMAQKQKIKITENLKDNNFYIYHQSLWIIPFEKWDYVITDEWYTTTDWKYVYCYDNNWDELWFF